MKLIYHLPCLTYDFNNSKFVEFEYEQAVKFLKLVYKDMQFFQKHFLSKLENIPNLQKLCIDLGYSFEKAKPLSKSEIEKLKNKEVRDFAFEHFNGIYNKPKEENKPKKSFFDNYVQKIKDYLDNAENEEIAMPFYNTSIVYNKKPFLITKIEKYFINEEKEFIHFNAKNVNEIELNNTIKHFLCPECDINKLILNDGLIYLDACRNNITHIQLNNNLEEFVANGNNLKSIELNSNLQVAYLLNNPLQHIFINKNLKELSISHPENKNIEIDNSVENNQVEINYFKKKKKNKNGKLIKTHSKEGRKN